MATATEPRPIVLLGPQRFQPTVVEALDALGAEGTVALVTAGWQEREEEVEELQQHLGRPTLNLQLYARAEAALSEDRPLADALRRRQDRLQQMQELYRLRLGHALDAARELMRLGQPAELLVAERRSAIRVLRGLDTGHLHRVAAVEREFDETWRPTERAAVARRREELGELLGRCGALAIAGGHVAVLLNRLRLFDLVPLLGRMPIVAWSAGAMALAPRVLLFHDSPPQGPGNAEVLDAGLGLVKRLLPLPHARRRLRLDDPSRVALLARRAAPLACVALDPGARVDLVDGRCVGAPGTLRLHARGGLVPLGRGAGS